MTVDQTGTTPLRISIITATFNSAETVRDALVSVATQTHPNIEHLIQDGGSTDETLKIIEAFGSERTKVVSEPDSGIYDALDRGIARASGDIIGVLHSDDFFANAEVLSWVAQAFSADPDLDAVYGDLEYVSSRDPDRIIRYWKAGGFDRKKLRNGWMPPHPTLFVRRHVLDNYGDYDRSMCIAADYDAMLRWLNIFQINIAYLDHTLVKMRVGGASNRSLGAILRKSGEDLRAIRRNKTGGMTTLALKNLRKLGQFRLAQRRSRF